MADTYIDLLQSIAGESRRSLAAYRTKIEECVTDAIAVNETETYWFNDGNSQTFTTVAAQEEYGLADNSIIPFITEFHDLTITIGGTDKRGLCKVSWAEMQDMNRDGASSGQPSHYAYAFKKIRLYPIPSDAWTITMAVAYALEDLEDAESNCWTITKEGGLLTRYRAAALFYGTHLRLADRAASFENLAGREVSRLTISTSRRQATGRIRASL